MWLDLYTPTNDKVLITFLSSTTVDFFVATAVALLHQTKEEISSILSKKSTYFGYVGMKLGDQDKKWAAYAI